MNEPLSYEVGPIRPPNEAQSLLVRVTRNCPWNRCRFCTTYKNEEFEARPPEDVCRDIDHMAEIAEELKAESFKRGFGGKITYSVLDALSSRGIRPEYAYQVVLFLGGGGRNVFLQDANSLVRPTEELETILEHLYARFPGVERVTTYARSMTLYKTGADSLTRLRRAGLTRVHVGLESGCNELLKTIRKGVRSKQHIEGGRAAMASGLELSEYVMPGVGGKEFSDGHARDTARVLNAIDPHFIRLRSFFPLPGSGLAEAIDKGEMILLSEDEIVNEIRLLIEGLDGISSTLASDHDRNLLMEVEGRLPDEKNEMLAVIDSYLNMPDDARLVFRIGRRLGYFHALADLALTRERRRAELAVRELEGRFGDAEKGLLKVIDVRM